MAIANFQREKKPSPYTKKNLLPYYKIFDTAFAPFRASNKAAGIDIASPVDYELAPFEEIKINMGLAFQLPAMHYGRLEIRSSLAEFGLTLLGGTIDEDYRGPIYAIIKNLNHNQNYKIKRGHPIIQLICHKISYPKVIQVMELEPTQRGVGGFGSTNRSE